MNKKTWDSINKALGLPKRKCPKKFGEVIELTHAESFSGENNAMYGKTHTQEVKDIISKTNTGRKHTKDHIDKTTRKGKENGMFGVRRMGEDNPNYKGGITNDPNYYRDYSRAKRLQRKQIGL
tara:strand:- start:1253 stop:1621 length:369 start_codon:yes stop_codon:yes gene_type:complete